MNQPCWDELLDQIEHTVLLVEEMVAAGEDLQEVPPFEPPSDIMPPMTPGQERRARMLMERQSGLEHAVTAQIMSTTRDLGDVRRRRRAALAYVGRG